MKSQNSHTDYCFLSLKILVAYERATCRAVRIDFCTHSACGVGWVSSWNMGFLQTNPPHAHEKYLLSLSWKLKETPFCYAIRGFLLDFWTAQKKEILEFWTVHDSGFRCLFFIFRNLSAFWCFVLSPDLLPKTKVQFYFIFFWENPPHSTLS